MRLQSARGSAPVMHDADALDDAEELIDLVSAARSGLRRDVQALLSGLQESELLVPLTKPVQGAPEGELVEIEGELTLAPHLLLDEDHELFCPLFTDGDILADLAEALGWETEGGPLQVATLPALVAMQMTLGVIDEVNVRAVILNPGDESELLLRRPEVASLVAGKALPLVGYVRKFHSDEPRDVLRADHPEPPPEDFREAITRCLSAHPEVAHWELVRGFDPERDLEPHWTVELHPAGPELRPDIIGPALFAAVADRIPPPGYLDVEVIEPKGSIS
jgi:hypothetical protein